jgi:transposase
LQQSVVPEKKPHWWRPADSEIRKKAIKIVLMRSSGMEDAEIAAALGIGLRTVSNYVQVAGKNGWLESDLVADPKERLEYDLMHKVVRNMAESLDSYNPVTRHEAAMEIAKGTLFKKFAEAGPAVQNTNVLKIQIIQAPGPPIQIREETTGGMPAYVEGEVVGESK